MPTWPGIQTILMVLVLEISLSRIDWIIAQELLVFLIALMEERLSVNMTLFLLRDVSVAVFLCIFRSVFVESLDKCQAGKDIFLLFCIFIGMFSFLARFNAEVIVEGYLGVFLRVRILLASLWIGDIFGELTFRIMSEVW